MHSIQHLIRQTLPSDNSRIHLVTNLVRPKTTQAIRCLQNQPPRRSGSHSRQLQTRSVISISLQQPHQLLHSGRTFHHQQRPQVSGKHLLLKDKRQLSLDNPSSPHNLFSLRNLHSVPSTCKACKVRCPPRLLQISSSNFKTHQTSTQPLSLCLLRHSLPKCSRHQTKR
jgi:hypothetical protein